MTKKISNKVLEKIKNEDMRPVPGWEFLLKKSVFWGLFGVTIFVGGLAFSVVIFKLTVNDWEIYPRLGRTFFGFFFSSLPYFWIVLFGLLIGVAYYNFEHTDKGYKYRFSVIVVASVLISAVLGFAFFGMGVAKRLENQALKLPFLEKMHNKRVEMWMHPEKGLLGGQILKFDEKNIKLQDFEGNKWDIIPPEMILIRPMEMEFIKIIGEETEKWTFKAYKIKPWKENLKQEFRFLKENFEPPRIK